MASAEQAVELLLSCVPTARALVDVSAAAPVLRRFKLDVSFASDGPRFSINDKNEPDAFRARIREHAGRLGIGEHVDRFFALSRPGAVQTTLGTKRNRASLYFEELEGLELMRAVTDTFGTTRAPDPELTPAAVCVDFESGRPVAIKDYWMALERSDAPAIALPEELESFRRGFPLDPERGTRRYLFARRFDTSGELLGHKLLWQSEAHSTAAAERAWHHVDRLGASPPALTELRAGWPDGELYLYPDLVCLNAGASGGHIVYVSVK